MIKHNQDGAISSVGVSLVIALVLLVSAITFGVWAFMSRQDYKKNTDQKVSVAVSVQQKQDAVTELQKLAEDEKRPLNTYYGPPQYGSIIMKYPRNWSALIDDTGNDTTIPVNGYFATPVIPNLTGINSTFALRMQFINQPYAQVLRSYQNQSTPTNPVITSAYSLPSLKNVVGVKMVGKISTIPNGSSTLVILPLRANTLELWTVGNTYLNDFNTIILPNFTFSP